MKLFDGISMMEKMLDVKWKRHEIIANNIANANVPGFKRSDIVFEELLKSNLRNNTLPVATTHPCHISISKPISNVMPKIYVQDERTLKNDENNVDAEKEMVEAAKNAYSYNITMDQVNRKFRLLQTAISEGRK